MHLLPRSLVPSTAPGSKNQAAQPVPRGDEQSGPSSITAEDKRGDTPSVLSTSNNSSQGMRKTTDGPSTSRTSPLIVPASPLTPAAPDITVISFTNLGMLDFALNWLWHLRRALGENQVASSLLLYVVGDDTKDKLLESGLVPESCLRSNLPLLFCRVDPDALLTKECS